MRAVLEGDYVTVGFFRSRPIRSRGPLQDFMDAMNSRGKGANENSLSGWINAMQLKDCRKRARTSTGPS